MTKRIFMSAPDVGILEETYVTNAIRSGWIAPLGPDVDAFESSIAEFTQRSHAVALSSGTAALHLALLAHGVKPGDIVVTSTMTFAATANAIRYVGAEPYFIDSIASTGNIDPALLDEALSGLYARGERPAAVLPVDLLGKVADYTAIRALTDHFDVPIISDAAESLGASLAGHPAGSFGAAAAISFNGNKIMTTSGGGMFLTDDAQTAARVRYLATQARQPVAHYEHTEIGYNYRLSNILAALGRAQLERLPEMIARRRHVRDLYRKLFTPVAGVEIFGGDNDSGDNFWLTSITVDPNVTGWPAHELSTALAEQNIESRPLWKPMHLQPVFAQARALVNGASERLFETGITLPSGSVLTDADLSRVTTGIRAFLSTK
ncbi:aminotransferase class I/II-fold pyridoxal phosphate-dependent enzyme [Cryobacterium levicorallinum]|uniref:Aminotransferase class I/II-fold pyridoxal phosphate-dependent enzyme n=1 Tax=Cryobacterium levicorallinum TaxID=995038 RepID=A0A1I3E1J5_9MICO|nr:aminotransferase class I/II-fold pyridoxal phosphate-dependent enzyme [Cryobacterium levicorallinum]TFB81513.1 aminotransferase class I/II-fold pyridoxal phosphate-dependent enzyme [Cryobacterium levicorallinum]GEP28555.1 pyridoxal-5'-phosphate-dependent protein [Cryobacterium levicorallinum]SFH92561.1 dTDP-4-amino-4,6-dideoxygalactose transaminase [Cryobacterium levicorallinum]